LAVLAAWLDDMVLPLAFDWPVNVVVVRSGGRAVLIDAGMGVTWFAQRQERAGPWSQIGNLRLVSRERAPPAARQATSSRPSSRHQGPVVTFSHGWPLSSDAWDGQMLFLAQNGFRVVALDRRGHGRSSQASSGNDMDGYAADLAAVIETLDIREATVVGHSTGGGEVARYIGRYGTKRVAQAVLVAAVPPIMLKSAANPEGLPMEVFDNLRSGLMKDRSQFYKDLAIQFYGANRPGAKVSPGTLDQFWLWSMQAGLKNAYESIKAFSETDQTEDLKHFDVPTLVMHGEDDQIVPVKDSAKKSARLIKGAKEIYYPGAPHGLTATHQDQVNRDLLAFLRS